MSEHLNEHLENLIKKEKELSNIIREKSIVINKQVDFLFKEKGIEDSFSSTQILKNAIQCKLCETIAVSEHGHHFAPCRCTFNHADGGNGYLRRSGCHAHEVTLYTYNEIDEPKELKLLIKEQQDRFEKLKETRNKRYKLEHDTRLKEISSFITLLLSKESYINVSDAIDFFLLGMQNNDQNLPKKLAQLTFRKFTVDFGGRTTDYSVCDEKSAIMNYLFSNRYYEEEEFEDYRDRDWDNRKYFISKDIPKGDIFKTLGISMETLKQYQNMFNISYKKFIDSDILTALKDSAS